MRHNNKKFLFQQLTLVSPSIANRIESNRIESDRPTTRRIESNRIRDKKKGIEPSRTELLEIMKETNRIGPIRDQIEPNRTELRFFWFVSASGILTPHPRTNRYIFIRLYADVSLYHLMRIYLINSKRVIVFKIIEFTQLL